jgi:hypothetical protein
MTETVENYLVIELAEIYQTQGLTAHALHLGKYINEIKEKIAEVTGLHPNTVLGYLSDKFKLIEHAAKTHPARILASERIEPKLAERFREEIKAEEKLSPEDLAKLKAGDFGFSNQIKNKVEP